MLEKLFTRRDIDPAAKKSFEVSAGWLYGLIFGIVLVAFGWGIDAQATTNAALEYSWVKISFAAILILPLCGVTGFVAARAARLWTQLLIWGISGAVTGFIAIHLPFEPVSAVIAAMDADARGSALFPFVPGAQERILGLMAFGAIAGIAAAGLQRLTTTWAWDRSSSQHRMTMGAWLLLWLGAPIALGLGAVYDDATNVPFRNPALLTHRILQIALHSPPDVDLNTLGIFERLDYAATLGVRDKISARYVQHIADFDRRALKSEWVDVEFDNGFIWRCQITFNSANLRRCFDLGAAYRDWTAQFLQTSRIRCEDCTLRVEPDALAWQVQNANVLGAPQRVELGHKSGGIILMRAAYVDRVVECRFIGAEPVNLQECK